MYVQYKSVAVKNIHFKIGCSLRMQDISVMAANDHSLPGPSGVKIVTREAIFRMAKDFEESDFSKKLDAVENELVKNTTCTEEKNEFLRKFTKLKSEMKTRWSNANRTEHGFLKKNQDWLQGTIEIPENRKCVSAVAGRPLKDFEDLSERSKRRKTEELRQSHEAPELLYAAQMNLRESGNLSGANVVKDILTSPGRGKKYREAFRKSDTPTTTSQISSTRALSMYVEASLTRKQYEIIRSTSDKKLYPCYSLLQRAKKECYPAQAAFRVTETYAEVDLQALLNHTVDRLLLYLGEVLDQLNEEELSSLELLVKWGCDGSQQVQYKQKFENSSDSDANIFQSSMVPLQLICKTNNKLIWQNPTPSSPRFCRPMRIRFIHETADITSEEINYFNDKIKVLEDTKSKRGNKDVSVSHKMVMTMVDGKVCNAATENKSTMGCYICKQTSKDFNKLIKPKESETENLQFGLSILHARIRFFETLLHLSYKLPIKKWQKKLTEDEKEIMKNRKKTIQDQFREELGLIVDFPKPGFGTSNDGNTSRRFFANAEISARITGIELNIIQRFATVLEVISSGQRIELDKFEAYCDETAKLFVELYSWHSMTPTVHKILVHGPIVIKHALLPIGCLSEEASEARNKHFRQYRQSFSRKFSREKCNMDILNRLLLTSDPFISSIRPRPPKNSRPFSQAAREMMVPPDIVINEDHEEIPNLELYDDSSEEEGWELSSD